MLPHWPYAAAAAAYAIGLRVLFPPVVCDDAYITLRTAFQAVHGGGLAFNAGQPVYVVTDPLWALLLAALQALAVPPITALSALGAVSEALLAVVMVQVGATVTGRPVIGLLAAVFLFANPVFVLTSHSGLELPLYLAAIAITFELLATGRTRAALVMAAVAVWVRVDGIALWLVAVGVAAIHRPRLRPKELAPSLLVLAGYVAFGLALYGQAIPASAQHKLAHIAVFHSWWQGGALRIAAEFVKAAFLGRSAYWYVASSVMPATIALFVVGSIAFLRHRPAGLLAPICFSAVYIGAFVLSGATTTANYPWYFVPPLILVALVSAAGAISLVDIIGARLIAQRDRWGASVLTIAPAVLWVALMFPTQVRDQTHLIDMWGGRERLYAGASTWFSHRLPQDAVMATNEIGTIGWYARPDVQVLDLYGLALSRADHALARSELIPRHRPHAILMRERFAPYFEGVFGAPEYRWMSVRSLAIGVRSDLSDTLLPRIDEIVAETGRIPSPLR